MATATITSTITDGSGTALSGVTVTARLKPGPAFTSGGVEIADVSTTTNGSGAWSLALEKTNGLTPTNSYWEIVEDVPAANGGSRVWSITVTANGTLYASVLAFLLPAATNPTALTVTAGDARYALKGEITYNVTSYGAVLDGVTDDTAAIQAAINAAGAAGGGTVYIGGSAYIAGAASAAPFTGSALVGLYLTNNVTVQGAGRGATVLTGPAMTAGGTLTHFTMFVNKLTAAGVSNARVCDLTISLATPLSDATGLTRYDMAGDFRGLSHSIFERLNITNGGISLAPVTTYINTASALSLGGNKNNTITRCLFQNMTGTTQFFQGVDCTFTFNRVENAWDDAFSAASAGFGHRIEDNWIDNTPVVAGKGAASACVYLNNDTAVLSTAEAMAEITVARNKLTGPNGLNSGVRSGVAFAGGARDIKVVGNTIGPTCNHGVYCLDGNRQNILIEGNTIAHNAGNGILVQANVAATTVDGVRIVNNDIHSNGTGAGGVGVGLSASGAGAVLKVAIDGNRIYDDGSGNQGISLNALTNVVGRVFGNRLMNTTAINGGFAAGSLIGDNEGYNPVGNVTAPAVPATTAAVTNTFTSDCTVYVTAGAGSTCAVKVGGTTAMTLAANGTGAFRVAAGQTITLTYTSAPTWTWFAN